MRAPAFWYEPRPRPLLRLLAKALMPVGALYGALTAWRMGRPGVTIAVPVICVGNLVAGGAGKTPTVLAVAAILRELGRQPFALSRGYGGRLAGPLRVDVNCHEAGETGDEPLLLAAFLPVIVARDRPAGARLAFTEGADVIVMDDGLQNPSLTKGLRLAVIDGATGIGNGLCLPAGPLRAPVAAQLAHVDALVLIGEGEAGDRVAAQAKAAGKPLHRARLVPDAAAALNGARVLALAGIGRPEKFSATLREAGAAVVATRAFADHHPYSAGDVASVLAQANAASLTVATTQKDWVKLAPLWPAQARDRVIVVPVTLVFEAPDAMRALLAAQFP